MATMECHECKKKSYHCKDCKSINHFIREANTVISEIIHIAEQMYGYRFKEFNENEMEISAREAEYIYQKCSKAEFLLRTSNTLLQQRKKIKREVNPISSLDWID